MAKCDKCKKNVGKTRVLTNGICNECSAKSTIDYENAPCDPNDALGTIKFKDFVEWMVVVFAKHVKDSVTAELAECKKDLEATKKELTTVQKELTTDKKRLEQRTNKTQNFN